MSRDAQVILCGPFPAPGRIGGYARCNDLIASSFLQARFGIERLPVTGAGEGSLLARLRADLRATAQVLEHSRAPVFHLTAQYQRGTYREFLQYRLARRHGRGLLLDIRAGCFRACYEAPRSVLQRALLRRMLRGAAAIAVEGQGDAGWIEQEFGREAVWLPNFVRSGERDRWRRARLDRPRHGEPIHIAYSGRLSREKGVMEIVEASADLARRGVACQVGLIGRGEPSFERALRAAAERLPSGAQLELHGEVPHDRLMDILADAHLFALPSRWFGEGHSNAVNEAMQVGLPVICSDQGFLADVVTPDCGVVLRSPEAPVIAGAVHELVSDWDRLRRMGSAAFERVYARFSDETVLSRLGDLYDRLLREPRRAQT